jgi:hypothetical protein
MGLFRHLDLPRVVPKCSLLCGSLEHHLHSIVIVSLRCKEETRVKRGFCRDCLNMSPLRDLQERKGREELELLPPPSHSSIKTVPCSFLSVFQCEMFEKKKKKRVCGQN